MASALSEVFARVRVERMSSLWASGSALAAKRAETHEARVAGKGGKEEGG